MSPSRLFILRPVATTLADGRLLLVGLVAYKQLPVRSARGRLSNDSGCDVLSGSRLGGHGILGHRSAGAAVRPSTRVEPNDLNQFLWQLAGLFCSSISIRTST